MGLFHFFKESAIRITATKELQDEQADGSKFSIEFWERKSSLGMICLSNGAKVGQALPDFFKWHFSLDPNWGNGDMNIIMN